MFVFNKEEAQKVALELEAEYRAQLAKRSAMELEFELQRQRTVVAWNKWQDQCEHIRANRAKR